MTNQPSKNARRQDARETARQRQEQDRRRKRRNRSFLQGGLALAFLAALAVIVLVVVNVNASSTIATTPGPKNMPDNGIAFAASRGTVVPVISSGTKAGASPSPVSSTTAGGPTKVITYIDWSCPDCKQFEQAYSSHLLSLVAQSKITLEVHPIAILDSHYPGSRYSSRAANAAACVANDEPDKFLAVQSAFYGHQPPEGSSGLSNQRIKSLVMASGAIDKKIALCIDREAFRSWVTASTNQALSNKSLVSSTSSGFGTPTVVVDGKLWNRSTDLISFVQQS